MNNFVKDVESTTDYYPFGAPLDGRTFSSEKYKFGFNGKEKDNEISGDGINYDFKFRMYDSRVGRFWQVDPLHKDYPWNSTYAFAENDIIRCIDLEGLEKFVITVKPIETVNKTVVKKQDADFIVYSMNFSIVYDDGSVENLNPNKPIIMFENKSAQEGDDKSGNKILMGKLYDLSWKEWKGEKNMGILFEKSPGRGIFIHPNINSSYLAGCKSVAFEENTEIIEDVLFRPKGATSDKRLNESKDAMKEIRKIYGENKNKLNTNETKNGEKLHLKMEDKSITPNEDNNK